MSRKPRQVELPPSFVGAKPPPGPGSSAALVWPRGDMTPRDLDFFYMNLMRGVSSLQWAALQEYESKLSTLEVDQESEIARMLKPSAGNVQTPLEALKSGVAVRTQLIELKRSEITAQRAVANSFYGSSPLDKRLGDFIPFVNSGNYKSADPLGEFSASHQAAHRVRLREAEISRLEREIVRLAQAVADAEVQLKAQEEGEAEKERNLLADRVRNQYDLQLPAAAAPSFFITAAGSAGVLGSGISLAKAIQTAIEALRNARLATLVTPLGVGIAALLSPSELGSAELPEKYLLSMALGDLGLELDHAQQAAAVAQGTVDLSLRMGSHSEYEGRDELFVAATDNLDIPSTVGVLAAHFDAASGQYSVITDDSPPRTLIWTPAATPQSSSTTLPASPSTPTTLVGPTLEPLEGRLDSFPELADVGFDDYVIIFPADSGLPPLYVMFKSRRYLPGEVQGLGATISGELLIEGNEQGVAIPAQIAKELHGRSFSTFGRFRSAFWMLIAGSPEFSNQFDGLMLELMKKGHAPVAPDSEKIGARIKYEIHHRQRIVDGGAVYDVDNMVLVSPRFHLKMHRRN